MEKEKIQLVHAEKNSVCLRLERISKRYESVQALQDVSFELRGGEIHGLVGENGAGKSTLVKIITGLEKADEGKVLLYGRKCHFPTPIEARRSGITAVYQDRKLFPHMDVAENIFMGIYPTGQLKTVNRKKMYQEANRLLADIDVHMDTRQLVAGISAAESLFVEMVRAISSQVKLLILDEPTAALTPSEAEHLFATVRKLRDQGTAILIISHRLEELYGLVDHVTVLRDGNHISTLPIKEVAREELIRLMVGRPLETWLTRSSSGPRREIKLRVSELSQPGVFKNVSFDLYGGEIVGMAGLVGSGRSEIAQAIFGISSPASGKVVLKGQEVQGKRPDELINLGLAYLPEKRDIQGLVTQFSISNNITLPLINALSKGGVLRGKQELLFSQKYAADLEIKAPSLHQSVSSLSGGNRQKVVFAKWLSTRPDVFILDEPTQGIDIGTKVQVHKRIRELAQQGMAVLLISSDLPEVLALSDRVLVVSKGKLTAELSRTEATQERVMSAAIKETAAYEDK